MIGIQKAETAKQHVFPDWVELQNEISEGITDLMIAIDEGAMIDMDKLDEINDKIERYNGVVPSIHLKKPALTLSQLAKQAYMWV